MAHVNECKGCNQTVMVPEEAIEKMVDSIPQDQVNRVNEPTYEKRIRACYHCSSLLYKTTCKHCGCLVKYKAKFADKECPHPQGSRW
ncbi:DUF6171 family protein [Pullulanibacillus pueri]